MSSSSEQQGDPYVLELILNAVPKVALMSSSSEQQNDPYVLELILNAVPKVSLLDAARAMDGVEFWHGNQQQLMNFDFLHAESCVRECLEWAETHGPQDVLVQQGVDQLAAIRAWTDTPLCYVLCSVMRASDRTPESMAPVLRYARLFFIALHALPDRYVFSGTLYRAERGVMTTWDAKMRKCGIFSFYVPTSFSRDPSVVRQFKDTGTRTVFRINLDSGWILDDFSRYDDKEVLLEPVCQFQVLTAEVYDSNHEKVKMGEVEAGLHYVEGHVRPGVRLLNGSRVKELEEVSYRDWQQQQEKPATDGAMELEFDTFTEDEWKARSKTVPKGDTKKKLSKLGGGGFAVTYRKMLRPGAAAQELMRHFAVKVVDRNKMEDLGITEDNGVTRHVFWAH